MVVFIMFNTRTRCNIYIIYESVALLFIRICTWMSLIYYRFRILLASFSEIINIISYIVLPHFFNLKILGGFLGVFFWGGGWVV